jgi:hypothetical protein
LGRGLKTPAKFFGAGGIASRPDPGGSVIHALTTQGRSAVKKMLVISPFKIGSPRADKNKPNEIARHVDLRRIRIVMQ